MKEVGDKFGAGELILPFVLQSAEAMKKAVAHLETYLEKQEGVTKGTVVLATVFGDVHDIGKNLVNTILTNNGYTVHDLGKQVPISKIIDKAVETNATAIGLSALLVSTSKQMPLCVKELHHQGLQFPVIIGGAAINRPYAHRTLFVDEDTPYEPGVFYAKDAFEGLSVDGPHHRPDERARARRSTIDRRPQGARANRPASRSPPPTEADRRPTAKPSAKSIPRPRPSGASASSTDFTLERHLAAPRPEDPLPPPLGRQRRQGRGLGRRSRTRSSCPACKRCSKKPKPPAGCRPRVRYGFFPANGDGNDLVIFDPDDPDREIARFTFPRQPRRERLCLADYFLPLSSGKRDVATFQIVTVGREADRAHRTTSRPPANTPTASSATASASKPPRAWPNTSTSASARELGIGPETGKRYSWGYPACPDLAQHPSSTSSSTSPPSASTSPRATSSTPSKPPPPSSSPTPTPSTTPWPVGRRRGVRQGNGWQEQIGQDKQLVKIEGAARRSEGFSRPCRLADLFARDANT